jgi:hypothetical protein
MRLYATLWSLAVGLWLAGAASAQSPLWGGSMGQFQNQIVDTRDYSLPIAQPMYTQSGWSKLASMFPLSIGSIPFKPSAGGTSIFPTPAQMPNADYLKSFGFYRARQASSSSSWFGR